MRLAPVSSLLALALAAAPATAAIINVPADQPTIQAAMFAASAGDEVVLADGVYTGSANRGLDFLGLEIVVRSASGDPTTCIIDCEGLDRGFQLISGEGPGAQLRDLTISNATIDFVGAGVFSVNSTPTINNCIFDHCSADDGGGIWAEGDAVISNCRFVGCDATQFGGGVYCQIGNATITNCDFESNTATQGGAGLFVSLLGQPMVSDCTFTGNSSGVGIGGGVGTNAGAGGTFIDSLFTNNSPNGMAATDGSPTILRCLFAENGDGIGNNVGGGLFLENYSGIVSACRFHRNTPGARGGGLDVTGGSSATIAGCSFVDNEAQLLGGGVSVRDSFAAFDRCTFIGNRANDKGSALQINDQSSAEVTNSHFIDNENGSTLHLGGNVTITDTLVCGDAAPNFSGFGALTDNGGNRFTTACPCYRETFEDYADGSSINGQGNWAAWDDESAVGNALTTASESIEDAQALSVQGNDDVVQKFSGLTSGKRTILAHQFVPADHTGTTMFIVLNTYSPGLAGVKNWSLQLEMDSDLGTVTTVLPGGTGVSLIADQWVEIRVDIDLDADTQSIYYGGQLMETKSWTDGSTGGGRADIDVIDLYGNGSSEVLYDEIIVSDVNVRNNTQDRWYGTIQAALDEGADGDDIELLPGTYYERIIFPGGADFSVGGGTGDPGDVRIDGEDEGRVVAFVTVAPLHGPDTRLHHLTIQNGSAGNGGGVRIRHGNSPTLDFVNVSSCSGDIGGGMDVADAGAVTLRDVTFADNTATDTGGALMVREGSTAMITRGGMFTNTAGGSGGGMYCSTGTVAASGTYFSGNTAVGGGAMLLHGGTGIFDLTNCPIYQNTSTGPTGGAVQTFNGPTVAMTNCTVVDNTGRGLQGNIGFTNGIVWGNSGAEIGTPNAIVTYSDVQGGHAGVGNIDADPQLTDGLRPAPDSPVVDAGDNGSIAADATDVDDDGNTAEATPVDADEVFARVFDGDGDTIATVDMGAFESQVTVSPCPGDSNGDGFVDVNDLNNVILDWGSDGSANNGDLTGPVPGSPPDGIVDVNDLNAVIVNWGMCP